MQPAEETVTLSRVEYDKLQADLVHFKHQLTELRRLVFGTKSERFIATDEDVSQLPLFAGEVGEEEAEIDPQTLTYQRNQPKTSNFPSGLCFTHICLDRKKSLNQMS